MSTGSGDPVEASVTIPAEALSGDQEITIEEIDSGDLPDPPSGQTLLSRASKFGPAGLTFSGPVTITFTYTDAEVAGLDESALVAVLLVGDTWQITPDCDDPSVPTPSPCVVSIDTATNTVTVVTDHFSTYGVLAPADTGPPQLPPQAPTLTPTPTPNVGPGDFPETGGVPPSDGASSSPYVWLAAALGSLTLLIVGGRTALRLGRGNR